MKPQPPVYFHETKLFKDWLKSKNYTWPSDTVEQVNMLAEHMREGLEDACRRKDGQSRS